MKKTNLRFVIDVLMFACLGGMAVIGGLMWFVIPKGSASPEASKYLWGLHRHQWGAIHAYLSAAFIVFLILHVILNWGWIATRMRQLFRKAAVPAYFLLVALPFIVLAVFWLVHPKDNPARAFFGTRQGDRARGAAADEMTAPQTSAPPAVDVPHETGDHDSRVGNVVITGQATLAQIAASTGLSVEMICDRAGLPRDIPAEMTLGRLRRRHGIQIQAIRDAVAELLKNRESLVPSEGRRNPDR